LFLFLEVPLQSTPISSINQNNIFEDGVNQLTDFIMDATDDDFLMNQDTDTCTADFSQTKDLNGIWSVVCVIIIF